MLSFKQNTYMQKMNHPGESNNISSQHDFINRNYAVYIKNVRKAVLQQGQIN